MSRLFAWSSNRTADFLRLCESTTSSLALLPCWLFFGPLLSQTSTEQICYLTLEKSSFCEESFWFAGPTSIARSICWTNPMSMLSGRRLRRGTSKGCGQHYLRKEQHKLLTEICSSVRVWNLCSSSGGCSSVSGPPQSSATKVISKLPAFYAVSLFWEGIAAGKE